ncbi:MAG: signal peptide peptidase SppA [Verrucomicrobiota bacterium]|nr:signal peptide peptidase SppA [Verrucomicrobiota bacterium]
MFSFLKRVFVNTAAMLLSYLLFSVVVVLLFVGVLAALKQPVVTVTQGAALVVDLGLNIVDTPPDADPLEPIRHAMGNDRPSSVSLKSMIDSIDAAADDTRISALYLHGTLLPGGYGTSYATLHEVRQAVERFKAKGKPVVAFTDSADVRDYYLLSSAGELHFHPMGLLNVAGLASEMPYFGRAFEKYGIGIQQATVGKYKSAGEIYTRDSMSEADREARTALVKGIWDAVIVGIAHSRQYDEAALRTISQEEGIVQATRAKELGLVDHLSNFDEVLARLDTIAGHDDEAKTFKQISLSDYALALPEQKPESPVKAKTNAEIAIIYAEGEIVDGDGDQGQIGGDRLARRIRQLRKDDDVKAVVLRVNSPGGSAQASEVIYREMKLLREKKPVVVSMGGLAASGGYWISMESDRIFAEPSTITGSIGVVVLIPHIDELANNFGITFDGVKTGPYADVFTISRPKTDAEMRIFKNFADTVYSGFIERVAKGRSLPEDKVRELAEGRVWVGTDAIQRGLVDEIGGLYDAIDHAAERAALGDNYTIREVPRQKSFAESLEDLMQGNGAGTKFTGPVKSLMRQVEFELGKLSALTDPNHTYLRLPYDINIR